MIGSQVEIIGPPSGPLTFRLLAAYVATHIAVRNEKPCAHIFRIQFEP